MAGNIKIIEPKDNFQKVSKDIIFNEDIDALTLGVYVKILALGKKWELNINGLASTLQLPTTRIKAVLSKLEKVGYLKRVHIKNESGRYIGYDYYVGAVPFPESERTDLAYECSPKDTNRTENQPLEKPAAGNPSGWKSQRLENAEAINRDNIIDKDKNINRDINNNSSIIDSFDFPVLANASAHLGKCDRTPQKFDFYKSLLDLGVEPDVADAWMQVRKAKKALNTEIAFKSIAAEIAKSGKTANECIRTAVIESWRGFKAEWLPENKTQANNPTPNPLPRRSGGFNHMLDVGRELGIIGGTFDE